MENIDSVVKLVKDNSAVIGKSAVISKLKNGKIENIFLSKNCPEEFEEEIKEVSDDVKITRFNKSGEEIGGTVRVGGKRGGSRVASELHDLSGGRGFGAPHGEPGIAGQ